MDKRRNKTLRNVILAVVPLLLLFAGLVYGRLIGFENSLEEFVESRSNGKLTLNIDKSSVDVLALNFHFTDVYLQRNDTLEEKGIKGVRIPTVSLHFGSIASMLMMRQFDIDRLEIEEPVIEISTQSKKDSTDIGTKSNVNVAQQVVRLYPVVESLLSWFNIESFVIRRAAIGIRIEERPDIHLKVIDLLVQDWNIKNLTDSSQLQLKIAGQPLYLGKAYLSFSGIEYNYKQRFLIFKDFEFASADTTSGSSISASGRSLRVEHLDYNELYENQRYVIKKAQLDEPFVKARFELKEKARAEKESDQDVITRLLKQALGEFMVDSTVIEGARIELVLRDKVDSVTIQLPHMDFSLREFKVSNDSNTFQIGDMEVDMNRTSIGLHGSVSLSFNKLSYNSDGNLTLTDFMLYDSALRKPVAQCGRLAMREFNLLRYLFYSDVEARSIAVERAALNLSGGKRKSGEGKQDPLTGVILEEISLKDVDLRYRDAERWITVDKLSLNVSDIRYDSSGSYAYALESVAFSHAFASLERGLIKGQLKALQFSGKTLKSRSVQLNYHGLQMDLMDLVAERTSSQPLEKNYLNWSSIALEKIKLGGQLQKQSDGDQTGTIPEVLVSSLRIRDLLLSLKHKDVALSCSGKNLLMNGFHLDDLGWKYEKLSGSFTQVDLQLREASIQAQKIEAYLPRRAVVTSPLVEGKDWKIACKQASTTGFDLSAASWKSDQIRTGQMRFEKNGKELFRADSLHLRGIAGKGSFPEVNEMALFHPVYQARQDAEPSAAMDFVPPRIIKLHNAALQLPTGMIQFDVLSWDENKDDFQCKNFVAQTEKLDIRSSRLAVRNNQLQLDTLRLNNNRWFATATTEEDHIETALYGVRIGGVSVKNMLERGIVTGKTMSVNFFDLTIRRDKRMPDPPPVEKPANLSQLLRLPPELSVERVTLKDGIIRYRETAELNGEDGEVSITAVRGDLTYNQGRLDLTAEAKLFDDGQIHLIYNTIDTYSFGLKIVLEKMDMTKFNAVTLPLQSLKIKSGYLGRYALTVVADTAIASGEASITYTDLHLELFKRTDPDKKNLGSGLITFLADGLLKNKKEEASTDVSNERIKSKSVFNFWIKTAIRGAVSVVRKGKSKKREPI